MSWFDRAKEAVNKGVQDAKESIEQGIEDAQENAEAAAEERKNQRAIERERIKNFKSTSRNKFVEIDRDNKMWRLTSKRTLIYDFEDLVSYELIQDGDVLTSGGLGVGRAVVGSIIAGPIGAVLGGLTKKRKTSAYTNNVQIRLSNSATENPSEFITLLDKKTSNKSSAYKRAITQAQETLGLLDIIADDVESSDISSSNIDELLKYKELLDEGIITQEEFDKKKDEVLN